MSNVRGQEVDKTFLSIDTAERRGFLHRDYIAHCFRWSHVVKYISSLRGSDGKYGSILDVGCGKEIPLFKTLYSSRMMVDRYVGTDVRPLSLPDDIKMENLMAKGIDIQLIGGKVFSKAEVQGRFDVATCFEVIEHMEPEEGLLTLQKIRHHLKEDGVLFLSTPNYDQKVGPADNHVCEYDYSAMEALVLYAGFKIKNVYGTFASQRDYKDALQQYVGLPTIFERLREYYDVNVLSTIFAPLFPEESRNCLWELMIQDSAVERGKSLLCTLNEPEKLTSSGESFVKFIERIGGEA